MSEKTAISMARGDGIGPEIMDATLRIITEGGANIDIEEIKIGEEVYLSGISSGIDPSAWDSLEKTRVFLKAPITTPQGGGYKSLNVTARKTLGLYANVRPTVSYHPYISTKHPIMDVVVVRENEEDLYAGIEHRQTNDVYQCLKLISRPGSEKIIRYAFDYAVQNNRKKVTAFTKDNIMKLTDGIFHQVFDEIAKDYPQIEAEHWIVDIGAAKLADTPENFDVVVMPNLYGDILSDVAAQIAGSVGLAGSANIGEKYAMFEAIHGSAPRRAGQNLANPSGLFLGSVMMLNHINQPDVATRVHNAWLKTIEDGVHTYDIYRENVSKKKVGTKEFADAVIERLGEEPKNLKAVHYEKKDAAFGKPKLSTYRAEKKTIGVDMFLDWHEGSVDKLGKALEELNGDGLKLSMISNRGQKVYPDGHPDTFCTDHWRCRFVSGKGDNPPEIKHSQILSLLQRAEAKGFDFIKTENLCMFDGERGYQLGQGE